MTVINEIEIDNITVKLNDIKMSVLNNDPIEERLNVVIVISNPCLYARRYILLREFVARMLTENSVNLFVVELVYPGQKFIVTSSTNKRHLQLTATTPLWHKENMVNLAVKLLLPKDYRAFAWIDADIEFDSPTWATDTLKILNGSKDVVQLFSHAIDMDRDETTLNLFHGFGYSHCKNKVYTTQRQDYWHPGFAWAITRKAYERIGGLYDKGILGSGDSIMALSFIGRARSMNNVKYHNDYNESMLKFQEKANQLRLGYTPGIVRHYYHGTKQNRKYTERWKILMKWNYTPKSLRYNAIGLIVAGEDFPKGFQDDILKYFQERREDN